MKLSLQSKMMKPSIEERKLSWVVGFFYLCDSNF